LVAAMGEVGVGGRCLFAIAVNLLIHPTFANLDGDPAGPDSTVSLMKAE